MIGYAKQSGGEPSAGGARGPAAVQVASLPPVGTLFASLLGHNPLQTLLGPALLTALPAPQAAVLTSRGFFPQLISGPFASGLTLALGFAAAACLVAAVASALRGGKHHHTEPVEVAPRREPAQPEG